MRRISALMMTLLAFVISGTSIATTLRQTDECSGENGLTWINPAFGSFTHDAKSNCESKPGWQSTFDDRNRLDAFMRPDDLRTMEEKHEGSKFS